ncbi:MAG: UDP-N-acetylmuramoyl-tripeptide--D-alanyl-D-alanine ligase, partial [Deltaproteobacteria bacterium]
LVSNTLVALGDIAHYWRTKFNIPVIAITGSSGKTTTKEMIYTACSACLPKESVLKSEGNFNNLIGLPLSLLSLRKEHKVAIVEMGTNSIGEIERLAKIALPTIGVITNIGSAHMEGLGSAEGIRCEKLSLFANMAKEKTIVVNKDDEHITHYAKNSGHKVITFGIKNNADIQAKKVSFVDGKIKFTVSANGEDNSCCLSTLGEHNIYNALATIATAIVLRLDLPKVFIALSAYKNSKQRMTVMRLSNGSLLIDDTYNANPDSMNVALTALKNIGNTGAKIAVLGDMLELGKYSQKLHYAVGVHAGECGISKLFLRGSYAQDVSDGAMNAGIRKEKIKIFNSADRVAKEIAKDLNANDCVLVKGSRSMKMEEVVDKLMNMRLIKEEGNNK